MNIGDSVHVLSDIITKVNKKPKIYAKANDEVKVVAKHGDVIIVQGKERFSVHISNIKEE